MRHRTRWVVKSLLAVAVLIFLVGVAPCPCLAKVSTEMKCSVCHTMHNSQAGESMVAGGGDEQVNLLRNDCLGCHTATDGSTWKDSATSAPIVYNTSEPSYGADIGDGKNFGLAAGNFYWVTQADANGHNIFTADGTLSQAPGKSSGGGGGCSCHNDLSSDGCKGCHMRSDNLKKYHHADDSATVVNSAAQGWYRFLSGHHTHGEGKGVSGIEDDDWQYTSGSGDHNEYLAAPDSYYAYDDGFRYLGKTMTAFCCGCHGTFHIQDPGGQPGEWVRHPSDYTIPDEDEYSSMSTTYNPLVPVARPSLSSVSPTVTPGTDRVMCLSCHRPHAGPYADMLRWDYQNADDMTSAWGCLLCHTEK